MIALSVYILKTMKRNTNVIIYFNVCKVQWFSSRESNFPFKITKMSVPVICVSTTTTTTTKIFSLLNCIKDRTDQKEEPIDQKYKLETLTQMFNIYICPEIERTVM